MEPISLFNVRYDPRKPSELAFDSSEDAKLPSCLRVDSNLAQISFKNRDQRIAEWPRGQGTNTLDFTIIDRNGNYYELQRKVGEKNLLRFSTLPVDFSLSLDRQRINTPIMNRVLDNSHNFEFETIQQRLTESRIKGGVISRTPKAVDPEPATAKIGPGDYNIEEAISKLRGKSCALKFSTIPRNFEFCQPCVTQPAPPNRHTYRRRFKSASPKTEVEENNEDDNKPAIEPTEFIIPPSKSLALNIKFSTVDRWNHPIYKQEAYVKTSGIKLSHEFDKVLDKRLKFNMKNGCPRGDLLGVSTTTANVDIDVDCGPKSTVAKIVQLSPIKYAASFKSKAEVGMKYDVPASGTLIGPGHFHLPTAVNIKSPDKPTPSFLHTRHIDFTSKLNPDPAGDYLKKPNPLLTGKFSEVGQAGGKNIHLMNVAKKKISKIYPRFAKKKYG